MKIRLAGPGYEFFTGAFGTTEFVDGVSVGEVSGAEARFFAALMPIENVADGSDPGDNALFQSSLELCAVSVTLPTLAQIQAQQKEDAGTTETVTAPVQTTTDTYTKEALEEIADKGGIASLREIGSQLEVKGTSIAGLISAILSKQGGSAVTQTEPVEPVEPVEPAEGEVTGAVEGDAPVEVAPEDETAVEGEAEKEGSV